LIKCKQKHRKPLKTLHQPLRCTVVLPLGNTLRKRLTLELVGRVNEAVVLDNDETCQAQAQIDDRIVSLSQPYIRPIVRGKAGTPVEFGAKFSASCVNRYVVLDHLSWDNFNESIDLPAQIERFIDSVVNRSAGRKHKMRRKIVNKSSQMPRYAIKLRVSLGSASAALASVA